VIVIVRRLCSDLAALPVTAGSKVVGLGLELLAPSVLSTTHMRSPLFL